MTSSFAEFLGQGGFRLSIGRCVIYIDPYLSNSVANLDAADLQREVKVPVTPSAVTDAVWVLITHAHIDHCDPETIPDLAEASPECRFVGPAPVLENLREWGIASERLVLADESWIELGEEVEIRPVPAAHPEIERDSDGNLSCVGFVVKLPSSERVYFAGDTGLVDEVLETVRALGPYEVAVVPVNEQNYFRAKRGIIGNMTVREAFGFAEEIGAGRIFPCHWDMFAVNSVYPDEIRAVYDGLRPKANMITGQTFGLGRARNLASIVIRTLNEAEHLDDLLATIGKQKTDNLDWEVVLIDSGSTDQTVPIARRHGCRITTISREEFSFGRSLNRGCEFSDGNILVFISGHCVPVDEYWLQRLCDPIIRNTVSYTYGRQVGDDDSFYSERRIFAKYYPSESVVPQPGFYCNNANSAIQKDVWEKYRFDEELTGLEDMELAKRILADGHQVGYVADAPVFHHHSENWRSVRKRFQREAIALQKIMPEVHLSRFDVGRYILRSIWLDWMSAVRTGHIFQEFFSIALYRWNQYVGSYRGNHDHRQLSHSQKERFFYPDLNKKDRHNDWLQSNRRPSPDESKQRKGERQELS